MELNAYQREAHRTEKKVTAQGADLMVPILGQLAKSESCSTSTRRSYEMVTHMSGSMTGWPKNWATSSGTPLRQLPNSTRTRGHREAESGKNASTLRARR